MSIKLIYDSVSALCMCGKCGLRIGSCIYASWCTMKLYYKMPK